MFSASGGDTLLPSWGYVPPLLATARDVVVGADFASAGAGVIIKPLPAALQRTPGLAGVMILVRERWR